MITINSIKNSKGAAIYYSREDNYYLAEVKAEEMSQWWGKGAKALGLHGKVQEQDLQSLLDGKLPSGEIIGLKKGDKIIHRAGYDICLPSLDNRCPKTDFNDIAKNYGVSKVQQYLSRAMPYQAFSQDLNKTSQGRQLSDSKVQNNDLSLQFQPNVSKIKTTRDMGLELG